MFNGIGLKDNTRGIGEAQRGGCAIVRLSGQIAVCARMPVAVGKGEPLKRDITQVGGAEYMLQVWGDDGCRAQRFAFLGNIGKHRRGAVEIELAGQAERFLHVFQKEAVAWNESGKEALFR